MTRMNLTAGCYSCDWVGDSDSSAERHTKTTTHATYTHQERP